MPTNVGSIDRAIRIVVGVILLSLVVVVPTPLGWIGVIPIATGFIRFCPVYLIWKLDTRAPVEREN